MGLDDKSLPALTLQQALDDIYVMVCGKRIRPKEDLAWFRARMKAIRQTIERVAPPSHVVTTASPAGKYTAPVITNQVAPSSIGTSADDTPDYMTEAQKAAYWFDLYLEETTKRRALEQVSAIAPITDNDRRWRHLEHGCQWVSWTETGGATHSFDPRHMTGLTHMRALADEQSARQVRRLRAEAEQLARRADGTAK